MSRLIAVLLVIFSTLNPLDAQNETSVWYFGNKAGLQFSGGQVTILTNSNMRGYEGCASIADASGNLLFYTRGDTIWNKQHQVMANGIGLTGGISSVQSSLIIPKPGNVTLYYLFTTDDFGGPDGLRYSEIDMTLAAGLGSVTVKNTLLFTPTTERLSSVKHCNGKDIWVLSHDFNSTSFRAYLVTQNGVSPQPVLSNIGRFHSGPGGEAIGNLRFSPNGKMVALGHQDTIEVYDFDNVSGVLSNSFCINLGAGFATCEFSPDGTKLYAPTYNSSIYVSQWDLCAGTPSAIIASEYSVLAQHNAMGGMQLANNGKIYMCSYNDSVLGVINNPNMSGTAMNYAAFGQSITPKKAYGSLPNFISSYFYKPNTSVISHTAGDLSSCSSFTFGFVASNCSATDEMPLSQKWNFGEPASGASNQSTLFTVVHHYAAPGSYTVTLIRNYKCRSDTLKTTITAGKPAIVLGGSSEICKGNTVTVSAYGADSFTWSQGGSGGLQSVSPTVTTVYTVTGTNTLSGCYSARSTTITVLPCTGIGEPYLQNNDIAIYPNPANTSVEFKCSSPVSLQVYNQLGEKVLSGSCLADKCAIDVSGLTTGVYIVKLNKDNCTSVRKLVIAR